MKSFVYEKNGEWFDTLDEALAKKNDGRPSLKIVSNNVDELLAFYENYPEGKIPLYIHGIQWGLEKNLTVPTVFNMETTVANHDRFTKEFNLFHEEWIKECWSNLH